MFLADRHARIGPADLYYQEAGAGAPLVLVHGLSGSSRWWRRNVEPLARRFRVFVIDLIRFGRSRGRQRFVLAEAADSLVAWMDRMGLERASFVGHSMGGYIAADLAARFADRVDRLVLVCAAALPLGRSHVGTAVGLAQAIRYLPLDFYPILLTDAYRAGPTTILRAGLELLAHNLTDRLGAIRAPVLVVWGQHDALVPLDVGRRLHAGIAGSKLVVLQGAGHTPMWDRPEAFNQAVLDFLTIPEDALHAHA